MAVSITVSQVRKALRHGTGSVQNGPGNSTTAVLGTMFHRVVGNLLNADSGCSLQLALQDQEPDLASWRNVLKEHTYDQLLGPLLTQQSSQLQAQGDKVLDLWTAIQELTDWLAELWWEITNAGTVEVDQADWFQTEQPIVCELDRPDWKEPVALLGQTDAVLKIPNSDRWCVLEWKTGQTFPEVDLLQACLYHMILHGIGSTSRSTALAVVSFLPQRQTVIFEHSQLQDVQTKLMDVVEQLASRQEAVEGSTTDRSDGRGSSESKNSTQVTPGKKRGIKPIRVVDEKSGSSPEWQAESMKQILRVLAEFGAASKETRTPAVGPTFVRFFVFPERGITVKKVMSAGEQLHLRLALAAEPVMSVVQGAIAIDLPRPDRQSLPFSLLLSHLPEVDAVCGNANLPIGMDLDGNWQWCDLANSESCHMLVVGTPGSGKSEWLRVALASLLLTNTEETLELLLIDPKQNAFTFAAGSSMLRQPIMVPGLGRDISDVLDELVEEMGRRNALLASSNSRDLSEHVRKTGDQTKRVIVICDEYSALLDGASKNERQAIEGKFKQLAQVGRAPGFHLVLATQQPRANVVSPSIRSLLPARVALRVTDKLESRVALEQAGAEQLLGNGDLLFKCIGTHRLQGAWLPTDQERLVTERLTEIPEQSATLRTRSAVAD